MLQIESELERGRGEKFISKFASKVLISLQLFSVSEF